MSRGRTLVALLLCCALLAGCALQRRYVGSQINEDEVGAVEIGLTSKAEVLRRLGPPDRILRHADGDVFIYRYDRRNSTVITLEEPVFTNFTFFEYTKIQDKSDRLVVLFNREDRVTSFGFRRGTAELERF